MRPLHKRIVRGARLAWREITRPAPARTRNAYTGAAVNRLLLDWIVQAKPADEEIRGDLRLLRARARELARNNSYARRYFKLLISNVIGPMGIRLQALVRTDARAGALPDRGTNDAIEAAWTEWAEGPVTLDGKLTLRGLEALLLKSFACDGDVFVRFWRGVDTNRFGLALQPIDADLVDERLNRPARPDLGQNEIRMGVEVDNVGRPVGYWISRSVERNSLTMIRERYFVPASEIVHVYKPDRVNQTRGVTWLHSVMSSAHMLDGYEESEAVAARIAAAKMGFFEKSEAGIGADLTSEDTPATMEANPGSFETLPDGYSFKSFEPDHPTAQFAAFVKQMLRKFAAGVSVFYNVLANDAEGVTYSTMRSFSLIERDDWRVTQQDFIDLWRRPLYAEWIKLALLTDALRLPTRSAARYMNVKHRPRGWSWIDPEKEAKAATLSIARGLATRTSILAEKGLDLEDVFRELAAEEKLAADYGLSISGDAPDDARMTEAEWTAKQEEEADDGTNGDGRGAPVVITESDLLEAVQRRRESA